MNVVIESRIKQSALFDLVQRHGSQTAVAEAMGVRPSTVGQWLNFRSLPSVRRIRTRWKPRRITRVERILASVGAVLEDVFPEERIRLKNIVIRKVSVEEESIHELSAREQLALPDYTEQIDIKLDVEKRLALLTPREEDVIRRLYGIGRDMQSLQEVGEEWEVTRGRIRQIEQKAMRKMRQGVKNRIRKSVNQEPASTPEPVPHPFLSRADLAALEAYNAQQEKPVWMVMKEEEEDEESLHPYASHPGEVCQA